MNKKLESLKQIAKTGRCSGIHCNECYYYEAIEHNCDNFGKDEAERDLIKELEKDGRTIDIQLTLQDDGTCKTTFSETGETLIAKIKEMKEADVFNIDSCNAMEKAFLCVINSLYGVSQVSDWEE